MTHWCEGDRMAIYIRRREVIITFGGLAAAWPLVSHAEQDRVRRIGILLLDHAEAESLQTGLRESLRELGFVEGQNIRFDVRSAGGKLDQLPSLAAELVGINVDVIVALFTPSALAAKQATGEIPIVFLSGDPLGTGIVSSLSVVRDFETGGGVNQERVWRIMVDVTRLVCGEATDGFGWSCV
jgi:putative ABC transport system substrate-binding protein